MSTHETPTKVSQTAPFCLMELDSTKIVYDNFYRYPKFRKTFPHISDCLNLNIYSGLLKGCDNVTLDEVYYWIKSIQQLETLRPPLKQQLEAQRPTLQIQENGQTCYLSFSLYIAKDGTCPFILIQLLDSEETHRKDEQRLLLEQLEECNRGLRFGEAFYNYAIAELDRLIDQAKSVSTSLETLCDHHEELSNLFQEVQKITTWTQLHLICDKGYWLNRALAQTMDQKSAENFERYQHGLQTLHDLIGLGMVVAWYNQHKSDYGQIRRRKPYDLDEERYRILANDLDILRRMLEASLDSHEELKKQAQRCHQHVLDMDSQILNHLLSRLRSIATDLSFEVEKNVQFSQHTPFVIGSNYYTQRHLSRYLINTLKYIIIEHLEIPKERKLIGKPLVCKLEFSIVEQGENLCLIFRDDGIRFDDKEVVNRAIHNRVVAQEVGEWMLEQNQKDIYNLMLHKKFGPPVKPPPLTCYRPYLSMICEDAMPLQGRMTFRCDDDGHNVIQLTVPKQRNAIQLIDPMQGEKTQ